MFFRSIVILIVAFFSVFTSSAQWTQYSGISTDNVKAVRSWNSDVIYASQPEKMLRTTDAGLTWASLPIVNSSGNLYLGATFYDFEVLGPGIIVAVGISFLGNDEVIYKSTDYGVTWQVVNLYSSGTWPRYQNAITFVSATTGFTVGTNGRILKTTNAGASWSSVSSGVSAELKDVCFTSTTAGFAVGQGKVLKTTNGGTSWSNISFTGSFFYSVHFPSSLVGYAVGEDKKILKTINGGTTWSLTTMNIPTITNLTSVYFVSDSEGYVTGANGTIYHTTTGGQFWEKTEMNNALNDVYFSSTTNGYLTGDVGQLLHTQNGGQIYHPIANFSNSPSVSCNDSIISLTNLSDPAYSYQWFLNGVLFSTNYNAQITINNPGQVDTINLVAFNGSYYDTLSKNINIQPSLEFSISAGILSSEICSGQSTNMYVYNSIPGIVYSLTKNGTQIGVTQVGNGSTLTFSAGATTINSTVCIKGVKTISGCGSNIETWCTSLTMQNPNPATMIQYVEDTICSGTIAQLTIFNSQIGVNYQLYQGVNMIGSSQLGNGSNLIFNTPVNYANTTYFIKGTSQLGCITNFSSMLVVVQSPSVYWTAETQNPEVGESVDFINNSLFPQGNFLWNFGVNATPNTSILSDPTNITFNSAGVQNVSLTYVTPLGCTQTITKEINVINPFAPELCEAVNFTSTTPFTSHLYAVNRDKDMNMYSVYKHSLSPQNRVFANHGDSLNLGLNSIFNFDNSYTLIKHNPKGVPMWSTVFRSHTDGDGGDVITDTSGNVYFAYYHSDYNDSLRIYSSDGRFISIMPPHSGSNFQSVVIVKFDSYGNYLWHTTFLDKYTCWKVSLKLDNDQNLFASGEYRVAKYNPSGVLQWQKIGYIADVEPDQNGGVYVLNRIDMIVDHYSSTGTLINSSLVPTKLTSNTAMGARHLAQDENGDLYIYGNFRGSFVYGLDTITDLYSFGASHEDAYLAKMSSDFGYLWIKQFKGPSEMPLQGIDVLNNTVMISFLNTGVSMEYIQGDTLFPNASFSYFLFKCDTLGTTDEISLFHDNITGPIGNNAPMDNVVLSNGGTKFDFGFQYKESFTASTGTQFETIPTSGFNYYGINLANVSCVFNEAPPTDIPIAYFNAPMFICVGETVNFIDGSINNPTQWSWTFSGGSITTSNAQNPTITFSNFGIFPITLTVMNSFGQSETYTTYVNVAAPPTATLSGSDITCEGIYGNVCVSTTSNFVWQNGSTSNCISLLAPPGDTIIGITVSNANCSIELFHTITVEANPVLSWNGVIPDTVCSTESSVQLPIASPAGGTYLLNYSALSGSSFNAGSAYTNYDNSIIYTYTTPGGACTEQIVESIFVIDAAVSLTINGELNGCIGSELEFYATAYSNATEFLWDFSGGTSPNTSIPMTTASFNQAGNYIVGLTASAGTCPGITQNLNVTINPSPLVEIDDFASNVICAPVTGLITVPSASPANGIYYDAQGAMINPFTIDPQYMSLNVPNYIYYSYDNGNGCPGLDSTDLTVSNQFVSVTINGDLSGCVGSELDFSANSSSNLVECLWDFDGGVSNNSLNPITSATFNQAGIYTVSLTVSGLCASPIQNLIVTINPDPIVDINSFVTDVICTPSTNLIAVPSAFPSNGSYYDTQGAMIDPFTINPSLMILNNVNYVYYSYDDGNGCEGLDSTTLLIHDPLISVTINGDQSGCVGSEMEFYSTASSNVVDYLWDFGGGITNDPLIPNTSASFDQPGSYNVSLTASDGTCPGSPQFLTVTINPDPIVDIEEFVSNVICAPSTNLVTVPSGNPANGSYYDTQGAMIDQFTIDPSLMIMDVLNYVYYSFVDGNGCEGLDSTNLLLSDCLGSIENSLEQHPSVSIGQIKGTFVLSQLEMDSEIYVYNSLGQIIREYKNDTDQVLVDLINESIGMYLFKIQSGNNQVVFRVFNE